MNDCPCCTGRRPVGSKAWTWLCDTCLFHVIRLQACPHEDEHPLEAPELTKPWSGRAVVTQPAA